MREQKDQMRQATTAKVCLDLAKSARLTVSGAINHGLQSPLARTEHDLLLPKPVKGTILAPKPRESGECRFPQSKDKAHGDERECSREICGYSTRSSDFLQSLVAQPPDRRSEADVSAC
jgi:hypothetical protein